MILPCLVVLAVLGLVLILVLSLILVLVLVLALSIILVLVLRFILVAIILAHTVSPHFQWLLLPVVIPIIRKTNY